MDESQQSPRKEDFFLHARKKREERDYTIRKESRGEKEMSCGGHDKEVGGLLSPRRRSGSLAAGSTDRE